uniref:Protein kinase domain-containing protein n=1 Tax=viral metagenome TaxID=1070528 RepID=A0A6C0LV00_9ZZZZ
MEFQIIKTIKKNRICTISLIKLNGIEYIFKIYNAPCKHFFVEMNILASSTHKNIIQMIGLLPFEKSTGILLSKEDISLTDLLEKEKLNDLEKIDILLQIAHGIKYLHKNKILHLDLKSDNIMLTKNQKNNRYDIKIIDFNSAEYISNDNIYLPESPCTITHRPPPFDGDYVNDKFDIWSFGMIIYEIYSNIPIYLNKYIKNMTEDGMINFIVSPKFIKELDKHVPTSLRSCLGLFSINRPNIDEVIKELFIIKDEICNKVNLTINFIYDSSVDLKFQKMIVYEKNEIGYQHYNKFLKHISKSIKWNYSFQTINATMDLLDRTQVSSLDDISNIILICHIIPIENRMIHIGNIKEWTPSLNQIIRCSRGILYQHKSFN